MTAASPPAPNPNGQVLLEARNLHRTYRARGLAGRGAPTEAVAGVDLRLAAGATYGLVGESGSGKSTLVRLLLALERPDEGSVSFDGIEITALSQARLRPIRRRFQAVFQDPFEALDPSLTVASILAEPLAVHGVGSRAERPRLIGELLQAVGLPAGAASRRPHGFSGGERQRIAIARALATSPDLLILDEPVSALDVSVRAQILDLLERIQRERSLTVLLVAHNLAVVRSTCETVGVMYAGRLVEEGPASEVLTRAAHPFTRGLLQCEPEPDPDRPLPEAPRAGTGRPANGCSYAARCPEADTQCRRAPELTPIAAGHRCACWKR